MSVQVVFLGTNGWYDTDTGNKVCVLVRSSEHTVIFDAGNGLYKADYYVPAPPGTGYLMLSHFHLDHVAGLHVLNKLRCFAKLRIFGPARTRTVLGHLLDSPFTLPASQLPYDVEVFELPRDRHAIPFDFEAAPLLHGTLSWASG